MADCELSAQSAPPKSLVLIHVSGSTPTGAELSLAQWRMLTEIIKVNQHVPFMVMEYQGLSSGDAEKDAQPLRFMAHEGMPLLLAQSFDSVSLLPEQDPTVAHPAYAAAVHGIVLGQSDIVVGRGQQRRREK